MPFFSIVIPTFNRQEIISGTIDSVISQDFDGWELIIVDDGSTDDTKAVIEKYRDQRIQYIHQENAERGAARNRGSKLAKGKYVFFLDSDDLIYPNHLSHAHEKLLQLKNPEFFHSRYEEILGDQKIQVPKLNQTSIKSIIEKRNMFACQFFLRKDIALDTPFNEHADVKIGEDWEVVLKIAARYPLNLSNKVTAAIVQHDCRSMVLADANQIIKSKEQIVESLSADERISQKVINNFEAELTTLAALSCALQGEKKRAWCLFWIGNRKSGKQIFSRRFLAIIKHILFS
ncbi:MAG: glycosyltransferase involved in cell wall biosynthesis [Arenicella sp.]|jgi:glycosyltransferase involved in cell wall biosynthesis